MPQATTVCNFTTQQMTAGPAMLSGGVKADFLNFSFGTNSTFDLVSPRSNVLTVEGRGIPPQIGGVTNGVYDQIVLGNTVSASGLINLIADSAGNLNILRFSRSGSNGQDVSVTIFSKG
jgi:hypothetical protein